VNSCGRRHDFGLHHGVFLVEVDLGGSSSVAFHEGHQRDPVAQGERQPYRSPHGRAAGPTRTLTTACIASTSQRRTTPSLPALARVRPSGEKASAFTPPVWPSREARARPEAGSQRRTTRSSPALARVRPSGEKASAYRRPLQDSNLRPAA
jgi:hypothetical protein